MLTKRNWWETKTTQDILLLLAIAISSCLIGYKNDFWICYSAIYIIAGSWIYHRTVEDKNSDIEYLNHKVNQLERYTKWLEEELEKTYNN